LRLVPPSLFAGDHFDFFSGYWVYPLFLPPGFFFLFPFPPPSCVLGPKFLGAFKVSLVSLLPGVPFHYSPRIGFFLEQKAGADNPGSPSVSPVSIELSVFFPPPFIWPPLPCSLGFFSGLSPSPEFYLFLHHIGVVVFFWSPNPVLRDVWVAPFSPRLPFLRCQVLVVSFLGPGLFQFFSKKRTHPASSMPLQRTVFPHSSWFVFFFTLFFLPAPRVGAVGKFGFFVFPIF